MAGSTNRGSYLWAGICFRGESAPAKYAVALIKDVPDEQVNLMSDCQEIAAGNGYVSGGFELTPGSTDFDTWSELDGSDDVGRVQAKNVSWLADGGPIPSSGDGALYAVLTEADTVTVADRAVFGFWSLGTEKNISDTQTLSLNDLQIDFAQT